MIYCNLSDFERGEGIKIEGTGLYIRNELAVILTLLYKTDKGDLVRDALEQIDDPEWLENFDENTRAFPDPNRRNRA